MKNNIKFFFILLLIISSTAGFSQNSSSEDEKKVRAAILDYVEGVYEVDPARIKKSVHPSLVKRGTSLNRQSGEYSQFNEMTFGQLVELAKNWNKDGNRADSKTVRDITVYDVQDKTATAKVVAAWGTDYFHLAQIDGKWYIMNVLWQSLKSN
ncbi:nuclear transport factor 2 family protein [Antarcticibacterium sp. 1MA-6-2]|uniref:nuclear transport factor 2 family protein n=1 Tax=Antarcticibacterium sp. 1MA-6-2 TaxID=2908210 RepID=UPI001F3596FB|nr:nuclear transport factor 2 family protein [Antarcticibacterium sp. 1MA-6-2]UJH90994.1 nuclear transport factor 2 family protein [Antarcticibacterium sp. 1MA-6-2]